MTNQSTEESEEILCPRCGIYPPCYCEEPPGVEAAKEASLFKVLDDMRNALISLYPHCHEEGMKGETDYERAWLKCEESIHVATKAIVEYKEASSRSKYSGQDQEALWNEVLDMLESSGGFVSMEKLKSKFTITRKSDSVKIETGKEKGEKE